jgi:fructose-1,6-bisphosphatase/inositol monophosphatase family enzyme
VFAQGLADRARALALKYFRAPNGLTLKGDHSPVTLADLKIEGGGDPWIGGSIREYRGS